MHKNFSKFGHFKPVEPPAGLFDNIIAAIKPEQELRQRKRLLFAFLFLLTVSLLTTPLALIIMIKQIESSGISYFISIALSDIKTFFALWQDFALAILESLPIISIAAFAISMGIGLFTLRLFFYKKRLLLNYLIHEREQA